MHKVSSHSEALLTKTRSSVETTGAKKQSVRLEMMSKLRNQKKFASCYWLTMVILSLAFLLARAHTPYHDTSDCQQEAGRPVSESSFEPHTKHSQVLVITSSLNSDFIHCQENELCLELQEATPTRSLQRMHDELEKGFISFLKLCFESYEWQHSLVEAMLCLPQPQNSNDHQPMITQASLTAISSFRLTI